MYDSVLPYRRGFYRSCLAMAPPEAAAWMCQVRDVAESVVARHAPLVDRERAYPHQSLAALREVGGFGVAAPVSAGGLGYGDGVAALMVETVAAACPTTAAILMFHTQVVRRVERYGSPEQQRRDLPRLAAGCCVGASAWTEPGAGADKSSLQTQLEGADGEWTVSGIKTYCTGLEGAGLVHVLLGAAAGDGPPSPTFVRVPTDAAGFRITEIYDLMGLRGSSTGSFQLEQVPVSTDDLVGGIGEGSRLMQANHETCMNPGLLALGVARAAYEEAKRAVSGEWEGMRESSGFQNTRFTLADLEVRLGSAYAYAAQTIDYMHEGAPRMHVECSKVKLQATTTAADITAAAMQLCGARGATAPWPVERHFRDARATLLMGPANEMLRERIAGQLLTEKEREYR